MTARAAWLSGRLSECLWSPQCGQSSQRSCPVWRARFLSKWPGQLQRERWTLRRSFATGDTAAQAAAGLRWPQVTSDVPLQRLAWVLVATLPPLPRGRLERSPSLLPGAPLQARALASPLSCRFGPCSLETDFLFIPQEGMFSEMVLEIRV